MSNLTDNRIQAIIDQYGGNFTVREFGADRKNCNPDLIEEVVKFRNWHGFSTLLTSVYRKDGAHSIGASDKVLYETWKKRQPDPMHIWRLATTWPWMGVGIYFDVTVDEDPVIMIHTDICKPHQRNRPQRWLRTFGRYYYQSPINGKFYTLEDGDETTLEEEIERFKQKLDQ